LGHGLVEMGKWKMRSLGGQQGFKVQMGVLKFVVFAPGGRFVANCMLLPKRLTFGQMLLPPPRHRTWSCTWYPYLDPTWH